MQRLEVSGAVRPIYGSLGVKRLMPLTLNLDSGWGDHPPSRGSDRAGGVVLPRADLGA